MSEPVAPAAAPAAPGPTGDPRTPREAAKRRARLVCAGVVGAYALFLVCILFAYVL